MLGDWGLAQTINHDYKLYTMIFSTNTTERKNILMKERLKIDDFSVQLQFLRQSVYNFTDLERETLRSPRPNKHLSREILPIH